VAGFDQIYPVWWPIREKFAPSRPFQVLSNYLIILIEPCIFQRLGNFPLPMGYLHRLVWLNLAYAAKADLCEKPSMELVVP
jgi:hypothetical protein